MVAIAFVVGALCAQEPAPAPEPPAAPVDLLAGPYDDPRLCVYNPKVPPQVRVLRSADDAAAFTAVAFDERPAALDIDYDRYQVVVVAWGALRFAKDSAGAGIRIQLERAECRGDTLHATVRTLLPPGPGIDIADDAPGRTWYPSLFFRTPRTAKVVLDVVGARRHGTAPDFATVTEPDLVVRIGPDACPSRERVQLVPCRETAGSATPAVVLADGGAQPVLEVAWGLLGAGAYGLDVVGVLIDGGVARVTVRAENRAIASYSGPGEHRPAIALALPKVERVALHLERVGLPLEDGVVDFTPQEDRHLSVTVDRSQLRATRR